MKELNINTWNRKEHFEFFSQFDEPFFGIVTEVDCTQAYHTAKKEGISFFASYLHKSLIAANRVKEFRYRIQGEKIIVYEEVHASTTILRSDDTFGFTFVPFNANFDEFNKNLRSEIMAVQNSTGLRFIECSKDINQIHYSSFPWSKITGLTHARNFKFVDSCPKITFGKIVEQNKKKMISVSVNAHHGLVDGYHVSQFLKYFQELLHE